MATSKSAIDSALRAQIFEDIFNDTTSHYTKINDRQYGIILCDENGNEHYCRVGVIVAEEREDMTASKLMAKEINDYNEAQKRKEERKRKNAEKAKAKKSEETEGE